MCLVITWSGTIRFATKGLSKHVAYNPRYSAKVNSVGMDRAVRSNYGRNMWLVMKTFNMPPNDPRMRSMDEQTLDFILYSLEQDAKEQEASAKGHELEEDNYADNSKEFEDWYENGGDFEDDDNFDADAVYAQVKEVTEDKSIDENLDAKLQQAIDEKKQVNQQARDLELQRADALEEDWRARGIDIDDIF